MARHRFRTLRQVARQIDPSLMRHIKNAERFTEHLDGAIDEVLDTILPALGRLAADYVTHGAFEHVSKPLLKDSYRFVKPVLQVGGRKLLVKGVDHAIKRGNGPGVPTVTLSAPKQTTQSVIRNSRPDYHQGHAAAAVIVRNPQPPAKAEV